MTVSFQPMGDDQLLLTCTDIVLHLIDHTSDRCTTNFAMIMMMNRNSEMGHN